MTAGMRVLHTMIRVLDLKASLHFYVDLLGMRVLRQQDYPTGRFTLAFVGYAPEESGAAVIELTHNWDQTEPYTLGDSWGHVALGVADIYGACDRLAAAGVKIPRPPRIRMAARSS